VRCPSPVGLFWGRGTSSVTEQARRHLPQRGRLDWSPHHCTYTAPPVHQNRSLSPQRLHRSLQKIPSGDFATDSFRSMRKFKESVATRAAPNAAALPTAWNPDGVRGNRRFCDSPGRSLVLSRERESTRRNKDKQQRRRPSRPGWAFIIKNTPLKTLPAGFSSFMPKYIQYAQCASRQKEKEGFHHDPQI
jgi:hypothetical protein